MNYVELNCLDKSWRSLRESNPSFQIENLAFSELPQDVLNLDGAKSALKVSTGYHPGAKQFPARGRVPAPAAHHP